VKKIAAIHNEKILDKDWLRSHGCALGCDSVRARAGSVFEYSRTSEPEFADGCIPNIANARSQVFGSACSPDIGNTRGYASPKST
jgi:hypothetical protein